MTSVCCEVCGKPLDLGIKGKEAESKAWLIKAFVVANKAQVVHDDCLHESYIHKDDSDALVEAMIPPNEV